MSSPALISRVATRPRPLPGMCCTSHMVMADDGYVLHAPSCTQAYVTLSCQDIGGDPGGCQR
jgi:hypothetical protein